MVRATTSLPEPDSPVTSTVASLAATRRASDLSSCAGTDSPMKMSLALAAGAAAPREDDTVGVAAGATAAVEAGDAATVDAAVAAAVEAGKAAAVDAAEDCAAVEAGNVAAIDFAPVEAGDVAVVEAGNAAAVEVGDVAAVEAGNVAAVEDAGDAGFTGDVTAGAGLAAAAVPAAGAAEAWRADRTACSRSSISKGFSRKLAAPRRIAWTARSTVPWPVSMMTG